MMKFEQIKAAHQRAEDSTKGAGEWLADFAADAHDHRGVLIAEVDRLRGQLLHYAKWIEDCYGNLPKERPPGPPIALLAQMRADAALSPS